MTQSADTVSATGDTRIRSYRPGDETAILELLETVFHGWPDFDLNCEAIDHWRWRYLEAPANSEHLHVCEAGGRIVGCLHHSPVSMKIGAREYAGHLGGDIAVLKPFRNRGLVGELTGEAAEQRTRSGFWFSYYETPHPHLIQTFKKVAFQLPIQSRHLVRVNDIALHLAGQNRIRRWFKSCTFEASQLLNTLQYFQHKGRINSELKLSRVTSFDARYDEFWERISPHYQLIIRRDSDFLNWRYADERAGDFRVICAQDEQRLIGYIVLRINRHDANYPEAFVVDLLCEPGRDDAARTLLAAGLDYFDGQHINVVNCIIPQLHPYRKILGANGFLDSGTRTIVFLRANKPMEQQMAELDRMAPGEAYYTYGDIDAF